MIKIHCERGDIFYADLNPVIGSEISETRPVLIISNNINNQYSSTVTIIPISTAKSKGIYPFEVFLKSDEIKLDNDSIAKVNQIRTIDKQRLKNKITDVNESLLMEIEKAINIHLDLNVSL